MATALLAFNVGKTSLSISPWWYQDITIASPPYLFHKHDISQCCNGADPKQLWNFSVGKQSIPVLTLVTSNKTSIYLYRNISLCCSVCTLSCKKGWTDGSTTGSCHQFALCLAIERRWLSWGPWWGDLCKEPLLTAPELLLLPLLSQRKEPFLTLHALGLSSQE